MMGVNQNQLNLTKLTNESRSKSKYLRIYQSKNISGFTLIELIVVIAIIGVVATLFASRLGTFQYWREEGMVRKLSELLQFLHHRAVSDGVFYRVEFNLDPKEPYYQIGEIVPEGEDVNSQNSSVEELSNSGAGTLSLELAAYLSPSLGEYQNMIPPRSFPSLAKPIPLEQDTYFEDIRTMRGVQKAGDSEKAYLIFSPRGFSEFGVIHLRLTNERPVTILINPFTGLTDIYREYKDFEWTYGRGKKK